MGAPGGGRVWIPTAVSFRVGERVVLFMYDRSGSPLVDAEPLIFREVSADRFSNGQLFADGGIGLDELREIVTNVRTSESCPYPEDFGLPVEEPLEPGPDSEGGPAEFGP